MCRRNHRHSVRHASEEQTASRWCRIGRRFLLFGRRCSGFIRVSVAHWGRRPHGASSGRVGDRPCGCRKVGSSLTGADFRPVAWGCWNERLSSRARRSQRLPGRMVETPGFGGCSESVNLAGSGLFASRPSRDIGKRWAACLERRRPHARRSCLGCPTPRADTNWWSRRLPALQAATRTPNRASFPVSEPGLG